MFKCQNLFKHLVSAVSTIQCMSLLVLCLPASCYAFDTDMVSGLVSRIDANSDGLLSLEELTQWMTQEYNRTMSSHLLSEFKHADTDKDGFVSWTEYLSSHYALNADGSLDVSQRKPGGIEELLKSMDSDKRRFEAACAQLNNQCEGPAELRLDYERFKMFMMPEFYPEMHPVLVEISLDDLDQNKDGVLLVDEYINAISKSHGGPEDEEMSEEDLQREYGYFFSHRDENKDGIMDFEEILKWIIPQQRRLPLGTLEARSLLEKLDTNNDGFVSAEELSLQPALFFKYVLPSYYMRGRDEQPGPVEEAIVAASDSVSDIVDRDFDDIEPAMPEHIEL